MLNGLTLAKFLTYITLFLEKQIGERLGVNIDNLQTLKVSSTEQAKLYNWNILSQELEMLDVVLTPEDKRDIIQGDFQAITNILKKMKNILHGDVDTTSLLNKTKDSKENESRITEGNSSVRKLKGENEEKPKKKNIPKAAVDINDINTEKGPNDCSNCVEFILVTLSKSLSLTGKQAAAFLAKENKFLIEACTKGLKQGFKPLINWYQLVYSSSRHLSTLISEEINDSPNALSLVLNTLKIGINSKSEEIVEWTLKLISKMSFDFGTLNLSEKAWEWFIEGNDNFLCTILRLYDQEPSLFTQISEIIMSFSKGNLINLFSTHFSEFYQEADKYWEQLVAFLALILPNKNFREEISPFLTEKVDEILRNFYSFENDSLRSVCCTFLVELWINEDEAITPEITTSILDILKFIVRNENRAIQYTTIFQMFKLLENFTFQKNPAAPILYKALIFVCIENHTDDTTRHLMMVNFMTVFES